MTLFHEIYGSYYRAVAAILRAALDGPVTRSDMTALCDRYAGGESALVIPPALLGGQWPLLSPDGRSLLRHEPTMPLTLLERRWLKAVSLDPRVGLFDVDFSFLGDVPPLFRPEDVLTFDRHLDGDDFADPAYISIFRTALTAVREARLLFIEYEGRKGPILRRAVVPVRLEYSEKDDCFRLICQERKQQSVFLVGRIRACRLSGPRPFSRLSPPETVQAVVDITDDRKALERVSLHFAHLKKTIERTGPRAYRMTLWYDPMDETEIVIRLLHFGPMVRVISPDRVADEMRLRIGRQLDLLDEDR